MRVLQMMMHNPQKTIFVGMKSVSSRPYFNDYVHDGDDDCYDDGHGWGGLKRRQWHFQGAIREDGGTGNSDRDTDNKDRDGEDDDDGDESGDEGHFCRENHAQIQIFRRR